MAFLSMSQTSCAVRAVTSGRLQIGALQLAIDSRFVSQLAQSNRLAAYSTGTYSSLHAGESF